MSHPRMNVFTVLHNHSTEKWTHNDRCNLYNINWELSTKHKYQREQCQSLITCSSFISKLSRPSRHCSVVTLTIINRTPTLCVSCLCMSKMLKALICFYLLSFVSQNFYSDEKMPPGRISQRNTMKHQCICWSCWISMMDWKSNVLFTHTWNFFIPTHPCKLCSTFNLHTCCISASMHTHLHTDTLYIHIKKTLHWAFIFSFMSWYFYLNMITLNLPSGGILFSWPICEFTKCYSSPFIATECNLFNGKLLWKASVTQIHWTALW